MAVVGLGYVGVSLSVVLAKSGYDVVGIQRRSYRSGWKIDWVNKGRSPISGKEPELAELLLQAVEAGKLRAVEEYQEIKDSDIVVITVQTPINEDKEPDLSYLIDACKETGKNLSKNTLICIESTVPPGTTESVIKPIFEGNEQQTGIDFNLVFSYERVTPGHLIENLLTLPRVIGGLTTDCGMRGKEFYRSFCLGEIFVTDTRTAETSKLVENSHRDVNIAFANEASLICQGLGVDFYEVKKFVNSLPNREGAGNPYRNILEPGAGVGGHCLPKDSHLLLHSVKLNDGFKPQLIPISRVINDAMPGYMYELINEALDEAGNKIDESKIGILGLSYKEDTGDPRNSPTLKLIELLDVPVRVHDPYIANHTIVKPQPLIDTILGSDCLVVMTRHSQYRELELDCIASMMRTRVIVDGRNLFNPLECARNGFIYRGIGHVAH